LGTCSAPPVYAESGAEEADRHWYALSAGRRPPKLWLEVFFLRNVYAAVYAGADFLLLCGIVTLALHLSLEAATHTPGVSARRRPFHGRLQAAPAAAYALLACWPQQAAIATRAVLALGGAGGALAAVAASRAMLAFGAWCSRSGRSGKADPTGDRASQDPGEHTAALLLRLASPAAVTVTWALGCHPLVALLWLMGWFVYQSCLACGVLGIQAPPGPLANCSRYPQPARVLARSASHGDGSGDPCTRECVSPRRVHPGSAAGRSGLTVPQRDQGPPTASLAPLVALLAGTSLLFAPSAVAALQRRRLLLLFWRAVPMWSPDAVLAAVLQLCIAQHAVRVQQSRIAALQLGPQLRPQLPAASSESGHPWPSTREAEADVCAVSPTPQGQVRSTSAAVPFLWHILVYRPLAHNYYALPVLIRISRLCLPLRLAQNRHWLAAHVSQREVAHVSPRGKCVCICPIPLAKLCMRAGADQCTTAGSGWCALDDTSAGRLATRVCLLLVWLVPGSASVLL
jgi:hypothetical protein